MAPSLAERREEYMRAGFGLLQAAASPFDQFGLWFEQAQSAGLFGPRAMTLATVDEDGRPTARMVILAGYDASGFAFCTDADSPKARHLGANPWAALVFHWAELERQVRIEGQVGQIPPAEADTFFQNRAWAARLATWAARQSQVIPGRDQSEARLLELMAEYEQKPIPRPPYYVGYRLNPATVEFWQGRTDRLHDRVRYSRAPDDAWALHLLAP